MATNNHLLKDLFLILTAVIVIVANIA